MKKALVCILALACWAGTALAGPFTPLKPFVGKWKAAGETKGRQYTVDIRVAVVKPDDEDSMPYLLIAYTDAETGEEKGKAMLYPGDEEGVYTGSVYPPPGAQIKTRFGSFPMPSKVPATVSVEDGKLSFAAATKIRGIEIKCSGEGTLAEDGKTMAYSASGTMFSTTGTMTKAAQKAKKVSKAKRPKKPAEDEGSGE